MAVSSEIAASLKAQGIIQNKNPETFSVRVLTGNGVATSEQLTDIGEAAKLFGNGKVGLTSRMTLEIAGVTFDNVNLLKEFLNLHSLQFGGTGSKVRPVVACKGTICKWGLYDTQGMALKIHQRFYEGWHDTVLPAKFKIGVGGCPNNCIKPQLNDLGFMGGAKGEKAIRIFIGGRYGRKSRSGDMLDGLYSEDEALEMTEKILKYFKDNAAPKERFGDLIDRIGLENVKKALQ